MPKLNEPVIVIANLHGRTPFMGERGVFVGYTNYGEYKIDLDRYGKYPFHPREVALIEQEGIKLV